MAAQVAAELDAEKAGRKPGPHAPGNLEMQRAPLGEVSMGPLQGGRAAVAPAPGSVSMVQQAVAVAAPIAAAPQPQPFLVGVPPGVGPGQQMMVQSPFTGQQVRSNPNPDPRTKP